MSWYSSVILKFVQKYIFVTGGVCSSLGKGIAASSIGALLKASGLKVFMQKLDPYLNVDPGTMSPFQHGEVFVTDDGAETDLDLGHYERFIDENLSKLSSVTTGKIYSQVLAEERKGDFLGKTIQIIPHITDAIQNAITKAAQAAKCDVIICEIGGTTGDIEGLPFLEAIRQLRNKLGNENTLFVHLTLLPYLAGSKELKTKPTQASVRELRAIGIQPDFIIARADHPINKEHIKKIALFCDVPEDHVIPGETANSIYEVPVLYQKHDFVQKIGKKLNLKLKPNLKPWQDVAKKINSPRKPVNIAMVGKYTDLDDAYLSVIESMNIAAFNQGCKTKIHWIDSEKLEKKDKTAWRELRTVDGILVPGGFGIRGTEGKIAAARYARENNIPYLGLCLGLQIMTIEFARAMLKNNKITSEEFDEENKAGVKNHIIHFLPDQHKDKEKGGTLRLGLYKCKIKKGSLAYKLYKSEMIEERHRHRYELNNDYKADLEKHGFVASGINPQQNLIEIGEIKGHPFMIGSQFHPEFKSRPNKPHPLFFGFIAASVSKHSRA